MIDVKRLEVDSEYWDEVAPEGATHYDSEYGLFCDYNGFWDEEGEWSSMRSDKHYGWGSSRYIPRPQPQPEWVDGLPPVGLVCEGMVNYGASTKWRECEILKHRNGEAAVLVDNPGFLAWCKEFRPIPTPEQRQREELSKLVRKAYFNVACGHAGGLSAVTEAILSRYTLEPKP